jgi:hypothetical protein
MPIHITPGRTFPRTFPGVAKLERPFGWTPPLPGSDLAARKAMYSVRLRVVSVVLLITSGLLLLKERHHKATEYKIFPSSPNTRS